LLILSLDIVEIEVPWDHIHMVVRSESKTSPSDVMQIIKSISARELFIVSVKLGAVQSAPDFSLLGISLINFISFEYSLECSALERLVPHTDVIALNAINKLNTEIT